MKIIENNFKKYDSNHKLHTCRWCNSKFEYEQSDITKGNIVYSQMEYDNNINGLICPCCNKFDNENNGNRTDI